MQAKELKEVINKLNDLDIFKYGAVITQDEIYKTFDLEPPEKATYKEWEKFSLEELKVTGAIRDFLLDHGKYLKKDGSTYRILLPSENKKQYDEMLDQARRKSNRADKLIRNTQSETVYRQSASSDLLRRSSERLQRHSGLMT